METVGVFLSQLVTLAFNLLSQVLPIAFGIAAVAIVPKVYSWVDGLAEALRTRTTTDQYALFVFVIQQAIRAAEQSGLIGAISAEGQAKKRFAIDFAERLLAQYGISYDLDVIADAIEAEIKKVLDEAAANRAVAAVSGNDTATVTVETTVDVADKDTVDLTGLLG